MSRLGRYLGGGARVRGLASTCRSVWGETTVVVDGFAACVAFGAVVSSTGTGGDGVEVVMRTSAARGISACKPPVLCRTRRSDMSESLSGHVDSCPRREHGPSGGLWAQEAVMM
jgi:hypothetical protein